MFVRWVLWRNIVTDGNMKAEHMRNDRADDDVALTDGTGFMVSTLPYLQHLATTKEPKQVGDYRNFGAELASHCHHPENDLS